MSVNPAAQAVQLLAAAYGPVVTGAAKTLPATASGDIFTVTGGRVIVTSITGVVSTAIQNQTCTLSVGHKPTGGSSQTATLATATSIANLAVGGTLDVTGVSFPAALVVNAVTALTKGSDLGVVLGSGGLALVPAGSIQVTTSATNTGAITWSVSYIAYDAGAVVVAA